MPKIFKSNYDTPDNDGKFVGFYTDDQDANKLTLIALTRSMSKSAMLREIIHDWLLTKQDVIGEVAKKAHSVWMNKKDDWNYPNVDKFRENLVRDLVGKSLSEEIINQVLNRFDLLLETS